jgi:hypothetical protein
MRRSRLNVNGDDNAMSVCHCHEFRARAALGGANTRPPFLARMNVPSM